MKGSELCVLVFVKVMSTFNPFIASFCLPTLPILDRCFSAATSLIRLDLAFDVIKLTMKRLVVNPLDSGCKHGLPLVISLIVFYVSAMKYLCSPRVRNFVFTHLLRKLSKTKKIIVSGSVTVSLCRKGRLAHFFTVLDSMRKLTPIYTPMLNKVLLKTVS